MTELEEAAARVLAGLDAKAALRDDDEEPRTPGYVYATEFGTGRVLWKISLEDVRLIAEAVGR